MTTSARASEPPYPDCTWYWINLDRSSDRRKRMVAAFRQRAIRHARVPAVDGRRSEYLAACDPTWPRARLPHHRYELATCLSHLKALHTFYTGSTDKYCIVCEDDLSFEYEPRWPRSLHKVIADAPPNWEVLQLGLITRNAEEWQRMVRENRPYQPRKGFYWSAIAYAITRPAVEKLLKAYRVPLEPDSTFRAQLTGTLRHMQSERIVLRVGPTRWLAFPPPFTYPMNNTSLIHTQHLKFHRESKRMVDAVYAANGPATPT